MSRQDRGPVADGHLRSRIASLTAAINRVLGWALVTLMAAAVVNVLWQVFTRFVLADPSSFTDELARYLLMWIGLLGASYATGRRLHPAIDLLPGALGPRGRRALQVIIASFICSFAFAVMVVGGTNLVALTLSLGQTSAALGIPLGYVYLVLPTSGILIMGYALAAAVTPPGSASGPPLRPDDAS